MYEHIENGADPKLSRDTPTPCRQADLPRSTSLTLHWPDDHPDFESPLQPSSPRSLLSDLHIRIHWYVQG